MTSVIRSTHWMILRIKHPRIFTPPTHFPKFVENFKIEFPGNQTNTLLSPESESLNQFQFTKIKNQSQKKVMPISNPGI